MLDIPPNLPNPVAAPESLINQCIRKAATHYKINPLVIKSIVNVEGGKIGSMSKNTNGTYDMGIMQINTIHLPDIGRSFPGKGWRDVAFSPCINIGIGTWILAQRMSETSNYWEGVGNYHSKTPKYRTIYLKKVYKAYKRLLAQYSNNR